MKKNKAVENSECPARDEAFEEMEWMRNVSKLFKISKAANKDLRAAKKRLGRSEGWIVDSLLLTYASRLVQTGSRFKVLPQDAEK